MHACVHVCVQVQVHAYVCVGRYWKRGDTVMFHDKSVYVNIVYFDGFFLLCFFVVVV